MGAGWCRGRAACRSCPPVTAGAAMSLASSVDYHRHNYPPRPLALSITTANPHGNAEIAGLDNDGRMCGRLTELKLKNFIS